MFEAFIGAFLGAMFGVVGGVYITLKCARNAMNTTGSTVGFFEIYEKQK